MNIIINDKPDSKDQQEFEQGLKELAEMTDEERQKDARWILLNSNVPLTGKKAP